MIYTVTFNPAIDYVVHTPVMTLGEVNRSKGEQFFFGGKGINVSIVLRELGIKSVALGFTAGFTGEAIERGLADMGIDTDFVRLSKGNSRINVKIKADVEWKRKIDEDKEFYLAEENNLQFNSKQSHTWYFKFGLYRNNYDYEKNEKTKIKDQEGLNELEQVQKAEEQNPMKIYFKNFSMKDLGYKEFEKEKQQSKNEQQSLVWKLIERFKHSN